MGKESGLGDHLLIGGFNVSGDVGAVENIGSPKETQDTTGLNKEAMERIYLLSDPKLEFTGYFNPTGIHPILADLPTANVICSYLHSQVLGAPVASLAAKQVNYDIEMGDDKAMTIKSSLVGADGQPLTWGDQLTAGEDIFTTASSGTGVDFDTSSTGGFFTVHVTALTGASVTVKLQDSADNSTFADVDASAASVFTGIGAARIAIASSIAVDRYVRVNVSGTFTSATIAAFYSR